MWEGPRAHPIAADRDLGFDWGVFYLPPITEASSPYGGGHPMCVIGGAATQYEVTNSAAGRSTLPGGSIHLELVTTAPTLMAGGRNPANTRQTLNGIVVQLFQRDSCRLNVRRDVSR